MKTIVYSLFIWITAITAVIAAATNEPPRAPAIETLTSTAAEHDARIAWWREARFGMFVHWGVSSVLGGSWNGRGYQGYAEHIQRVAKIPVPVYHEKVAGAFNPTNFDADAWIKLAKDTGMGYFIITAKHHDGFAMFDSKASPWNVVKSTPWHHDPMKDLAAACRKHGLKFGFYYSHAFDWGEENGAGNDWDWPNPGGDKLLHGSDWWLTYPEFLPKVRKYVDEKAIPQILELITNYHPDILWFDTPHKIPPEENLRIFAAVRKADPNIVINGRIFSGANPDCLRLTDYINTGDKPGEFAPQDGDWEGIPTTNESFGYNANDHSHKPPGHFIRLLAKAAARGGNILLNMGPRGDGAVDAADVKIFLGIGAWWITNGESIRGTTRTPLPRQTWTGESTRKGNTLYLHIFDWPKTGELLLSGLKTDVRRVHLLAAPSAVVEVKRLNEFDVLLTGLPVTAPDEADSVIAVDCASQPVADTAQLITPEVAKNVLQGLDSKLSGPAAYRAGRGVGDAWVVNWINTNAAVTWKVRVNEKTTFKASLVYDASAGTAQNRLVDGDAGKELAKANSGAGGSYVVTIAGQTFEHAVKIGRPINEPLGQVTLAPGEHDVRVAAKEVTGAELFRLRRLELVPIAKAESESKPAATPRNLIRTAKPPLTPRINGPKIYGVRPGSPFLFRIPATGERPMTFAVENLPGGLSLDADLGIITGTLKERGTFAVTLVVSNALGVAKRDFRIEVGDRIALTPPMGWNSYYGFRLAISDKLIREQADAMVKSGLADHGWSYLNLDEGWTMNPAAKDPLLNGAPREADGRIRANGRFPDMKVLCDYVHGKGLKIGLYSSPGPLNCGGFVGSYQHEEQDAQSYADWGFDFLKYDWCSYKQIAKDDSVAEARKPYELMSRALRKTRRDIVFSFCQYGMGNSPEWAANAEANTWRTTRDIIDKWETVANYGFGQAGLAKFSGPGRWNDPDMLMVGVMVRNTPSRLTPDEHYTHVSLWCLLNAPLIIGGDLRKLDEFTLGLLTNDEVIEVNQDPLGQQASRVAQDAKAQTEVWAKHMEDGARAVGLFNRSEQPACVTVKWNSLQLQGAQTVRDLWRQKNLGVFTNEFAATVPAHGVELIRVQTKR